jgi:hypothetical protein
VTGGATNERKTIIQNFFLNHRYGSADVNLTFFELFERADLALQFEVDVGTFATNVTRLERMVRNSNAFLGIYPYSGEFDVAPSIESLKKESRYFQLELDLAIRSRKPALIYSDERFRGLLNAPGLILKRSFDPREITGSISPPSTESLRQLFNEFCQLTERSILYENSRERLRDGSDLEVAVLLPPETGPFGYSRTQIQSILEQLRDSGYNAKELPWPEAIDLHFHSQLERLDWIIIDIGPQSAENGVTAFLHGRFIPTMRLKKVVPGEEDISPLERTLFGGFSVGYNKDILRWCKFDELQSGVAERVARIYQPARLIRTSAEAYEYFRKAKLRKEAVFLSYSGKDQDVASEIAATLKKYFQNVFDYRDGSSIEPGKPWLSEIFGKLSRAAIAVPLLSADYLASGNCMHEANEIVALYDSKKMRVLPVKVRDEQLNLPEWLTNLQYVRLKDLKNDYDALAKIIVKLAEEPVSPK